MCESSILIGGAPVEGWISKGPECYPTTTDIDEGTFYGAISQKDLALLTLEALQWSVLVRLGSQGEVPSEHPRMAAALCRPYCWAAQDQDLLRWPLLWPSLYPCLRSS